MTRRVLDFEHAIPNSSSSFSSDSDDDDNDDSNEKFGRGMLDEDRIRAQLLQSFYGASASDAPPVKTSSGMNNEVNSEDMDDINYDAIRHVRSLLETMSTEQLLVKNEAWTHEIRSLDSTMQTLVYENYQKFIHATDAVKSIGESVHQSQEALDQLSTSMAVVQERARRIEDQLKDSREKIAEKLRVKDQLESLQSILKLPETLQECIRLKNYKDACNRADKAMKTLSQEGFQTFQSLRRIQTECINILLDLKQLLDGKLNSWSHHGSTSMYSQDSTDNVIIDAPGSVGDIFECVAALLIIENKQLCVSSDNNRVETQDDLYRSLSSKALQASNSYLLNYLKTNFKKYDALFLKHILEVVTAHIDIFGNFSKSDDESSSNTFKLVTALADAFLESVRSRNAYAGCYNDSMDSEFTKALNNYLRQTREFLSDLEVLLVESSYKIVQADIESFFSDFSKRIMTSIENSIRDKIRYSFLALSQRSNECLNSFLSQIGRYMDADKMRHLARMMIVELAEDAETVISGLSVSLKSLPMTLEFLEKTVVSEARKFTEWLSISLEVVAGCEDTCFSSGTLWVATNTVYSMEGRRNQNLSTNNDFLVEWPRPKSIDFSDIEALNPLKTKKSKHQLTVMLVIADTCRLAEQIIIAAINESISFMFLDNEKGSDSDLVADKNVMNISINADGSVTKAFRNATSRILSQYSAIWANAAICAGFSDLNDFSINELAEKWYISESKDQLKPRSGIIEMLMFVKEASTIFVSVFGTPTKVGHTPSSRDITLMAYHHKRSHFLSSNESIKMKGGQLLLDVERMLASRTPVFCNVDTSLDSINSSIIRIILKAYSERARMCRLFSEKGYLQLEIDALFIRVFIPHYIVSAQLSLELEHLLDDVLVNAAERCQEVVNVKNEEYTHVTDVVRLFLDEGSNISKLVIRNIDNS